MSAVTSERPSGATEAVDPDVARNLGMDTRGRARRWAIRVVALAVAVGLVAGGWLAYRHFTRPRPVEYQTVAVSRGEVLEGVESTGTVEPLRTVSVGPDVSGRVVAVHVDYNDRVEEGQVLVEIDPLPFEARRSEARARSRRCRYSSWRAMTKR